MDKAIEKAKKQLEKLYPELVIEASIGGFYCMAGGGTSFKDFVDDIIVLNQQRSEILTALKEDIIKNYEPWESMSRSRVLGIIQKHIEKGAKR